MRHLHWIVKWSLPSRRPLVVDFTYWDSAILLK
jgi:hypothetical protein